MNEHTPADPTGGAHETDTPRQDRPRQDTPPPQDPPRQDPPRTDPPPRQGPPPPNDPPPRQDPSPRIPPPGRPLTRRSDNRVLAGVASGLGDYFGVDPAILRLIFVALAMFGGSGIALYILGAIFIPDRRRGESFAEDVIHRAGGGRSVVGFVVLAIATLVIIGNVDSFGGGLFWAAVLIGVGILVFRSEESGRRAGTTAPPPDDPIPGPDADARTPSTAAGTPAAETTPAGGGAHAPPRTAPVAFDRTPLWPGEPLVSDEPATGHHHVVDDGWRPTPLTEPPEPPRPPSLLGRVTIAAGLVLIGVVALLDNVTGLDVGVTRYAALALTVVGTGLVVGARWGRARGLIGLGIVLALVVAVSSTVPALPTNGMGQRVASPETVAELQDSYELGVGQLDLDLSDLELEPGQRVPVDAEIGMGQLVVTLPPDVGYEIDASTTLGEVIVLDEFQEGDGATVEVTERGPEGSPTLVLDLYAGVGQIEVDQAPEVQ